jgi:copper(I)-binding protein
VIRNDGPAADALLGASSPIVTSVELHKTMAMGSGDMMGMVPVSRIDVPAGGSVELKPGGFHLMMLDPTATLTVGGTVDITLRFEQAGTITVKAEVRAN